jgi:hypothetical protein
MRTGQIKQDHSSLIVQCNGECGQGKARQFYRPSDLTRNYPVCRDCRNRPLRRIHPVARGTQWRRQASTLCAGSAAAVVMAESERRTA